MATEGACSFAPRNFCESGTRGAFWVGHFQAGHIAPPSRVKEKEMKGIRGISQLSVRKLLLHCKPEYIEKTADETSFVPVSALNLGRCQFSGSCQDKVEETGS